MQTNETAKMKVLVTGGCGRIGSHFVRSNSGKYSFRVADKVAWDAASLGALPGESQVVALEDLAGCRRACAGMDMVIHLAADPDPEADFMESLLQNNFLATYNMFEAARAAGCRRFIFASSVHAVGSYPRDVQVRESMPVRPTTHYGVSKCFGEAMAAYYAINEGMSSIAIRIGAYTQPEDVHHLFPEALDAFLHPDDLNHLLVQCLETPNITFQIAHAISDNRFKRIDLTETREALGYQPRYDAFEMMGFGRD